METKYNHLQKMKPGYQWYKIIILLLLPLLFLASCEKNNQEQFNKAQQTVFQYINSNKSLTLYQAALKRAGMYNTETFSTGGPYTVFAPADSAFINAGLTLDSINKYNPQALSLVLKYTIAYGKISSASLIGFYTQDVPSQNPTHKPRIAKNYYGIFFDGIPLVTGASMDLGDGAVKELSRMPFPPATNIFDLISKSPNLTFFATILKHMGYDTILSVPPPPSIYVTGDDALYYTVLAPTDEAYKKFGYADTAAINADSSGNLQSYISSYIIRGKVLTSSFIGGYTFFNRYNFYAETDGLSIFSPGNVGLTNIIHPDIIATNGVLDIVDQVIAD